MERYNRHIILSEIGKEGQDKLSNAKVLVVGAGGLGCPVLQYLAAAGVGTLGVIDFDVVSTSNLQRQVLFGTSSLGLNKAEAAKQRLQDLNDTITIHAYPIKLMHSNVLQLFMQYHIIVDGTDNFETRYLINDACIIKNIPFVFGAIYKFEGQVSVFNYNKGPSYRCLFPNPQKKGSVPNCSEIGVLGVLPGIIGTMQANEVLKIILGIGTVLSGKLLFYNALTLQSTMLGITKSEEGINEILSEKDDFQKKHVEEICTLENMEISIKDVTNLKKFQFIDVREIHELPIIEVIPVTSIPLSTLKNNLKKIDSKKEKAIFCQSGIRSKSVVSILKQFNINNCYNIKEGASEIKIHFKDLTDIKILAGEND